MKQPIKHRSPFYFLFFTLLAVHGGAQPTTAPSGESWQSYQKARTVVLNALRAHGGETALRQVRTLYRKGSGRLVWQGQSRNPETPYDETALEIVTWLDFENERIHTEERFGYGGHTVETISVFNGEKGYRRSTFSAGRPTALTVTQLGPLKTGLRRDPVRMLFGALKRAASLRYLARSEWQGRPHDVVAWADADGTFVGVYIDAQSHLVSKYEFLRADAVLGDTTDEIIWTAYRPVAGLQLPFQITMRTAGEVTREIRLSEVSLNAQLPAEMFGIPPDLADTPGPDSSGVTQLAPGVYFLRGSHNCLLISMKDYIIAVEAARGEDWANTIIEKAQQIAPNKPVRYLINTHYHFDHSGGTRTFVAEGATIVAHSLAEGHYRRMTQTAHSLDADRLSLAPRPLQFQGVEDKFVLDDGNQKVEIYAIASPHSDDMLIVYLPKEKIVYVSDIFSINFPPGGQLPPRFNFVPALDRELKRLALAVQTFAPSHGRVGSAEDFVRLLASGGS